MSILLLFSVQSWFGGNRSLSGPPVKISVTDDVDLHTVSFGGRFYFSNTFPTVKTVGVYGAEKIFTKWPDKDLNMT